MRPRRESSCRFPYLAAALWTAARELKVALIETVPPVIWISCCQIEAPFRTTNW
jgi:hypothetical protein